MLLLTGCIVTLGGVQESWANEGAGIVTTVTYFDNNTGDPGFDVLSKGLADMMVSDLSELDGVQVVERRRLDAVFAELKLQKTKFIDPATAQLLGRGVGAGYVVAGAIASASPQLRLDVRLIEVATRKVVVSSRVVGPSDDLFTLQQRLVAKFAAALRLRRPADLSSRVGTLDALLGYSRAVDAADRGQLEQARTELGKIVVGTPGFKLAQDRYLGLFREIVDARERRKTVLKAGVTQLRKRIAAQVRRRVDFDAADAKTVARYASTAS
jgi:TolB-like protein